MCWQILLSSFQIALQKRDIKYFVVMPFIFGILHFGYGLGSLLGVFKILGTAQFWKKLPQDGKGVKKWKGRSIGLAG